MTSTAIPPTKGSKMRYSSKSVRLIIAAAAAGVFLAQIWVVDPAAGAAEQRSAQVSYVTIGAPGVAASSNLSFTGTAVRYITMKYFPVKYTGPTVTCTGQNSITGMTRVGSFTGVNAAFSRFEVAGSNFGNCSTSGGFMTLVTSQQAGSTWLVDVVGQTSTDGRTNVIIKDVRLSMTVDNCSFEVAGSIEASYANSATPLLATVKATSRADATLSVVSAPSNCAGGFFNKGDRVSIDAIYRVTALQGTAPRDPLTLTAR